MPPRHDSLFDRIVGFQPLLAAARMAIKGKRAKQVPAAFKANLEREVLRLERELTTRTWRPGGYVTIMVKDPKPRMVSAAPFRDRVVHHAVSALVQPIFEAGFIPDSYANRQGKGTHRAVDRYEGFRDRMFDPAREPVRPPPAIASTGADPGTTIPGTSAPPPATGTP